MDVVFEGLSSFLQLNTFPSFALAIALLALLGVLLSLGRRFETVLRIERLGIPIALVVGLIALLLGPYGPLHVLPKNVADIWTELPTPLLTLIFATLMLGRPLPKSKGLWRPVASQALLALLLGFGQYLVGGLAVLFLLIPLLNVDPLMGCLIEVGFEGGHGAAAVMGESFNKLGFPGGLDLGLAMATVGLLSSTIIGSVLVFLARQRGWVVSKSLDLVKSDFDDIIEKNPIKSLEKLLINLALIGFSVIIGCIFLYFLRLSSSYIGGIFEEVLLVFPVFPMALLGSLLVRITLEKTNFTFLSSELLQREISTLSTDLLITTAMASMNLPLLASNWLPILILASIGLIWNLFGMFTFARITFRKEWFERSITEFGNATGVAASGLLLLRLADPKDVTKTLPIFSIKQLFLQPLLSGGLVTVIAPLAIIRFGLAEWTEICAVLTTLFILISFFLNQDLSRETY